MAEVEKKVVISFVARNFIKETADQIQINMRGLAFQFQAAAYSIGELNKLMFGSSEIGKQFTSVLHGIGAALRLVTAAQQLATAASAILRINIATLTKEYLTLIATTVVYIARTFAAAAADLFHLAILKAKAIAAAVAHAISSLGLLLPVIAAVGAAAVAIATGLLSSVPSRQFGGAIEKSGLYMLHSGERVLTRGQQRGNVTINVYGSDSPHKTADTIVSKLRSAGAI